MLPFSMQNGSLWLLIKNRRDENFAYMQHHRYPAVAFFFFLSSTSSMLSSGISLYFSSRKS